MDYFGRFWPLQGISIFQARQGGDLTGKIFAGEQRHRIDLVTTDVSSQQGSWNWLMQQDRMLE